jgi:hypothetical protein
MEAANRIGGAAKVANNAVPSLRASRQLFTLIVNK